MEDIIPTVYEHKWCIVRQEIITKQIQTPEGTQYIQQPINIPVFFRNTDEIVQFYKEQQEAGNTQISMHYIMRDINEESEWYYA